jgi:hypothetical protein
VDRDHELFLANGNNEAIIPKEVFMRVQEEKARRTNMIVDENGVRVRKNTKYSTKVIENNN